MDSGLVFCGRDDFESVGGYDEDRLYGEDVKFLWELRRKGISRGQSLARLSRF
jgi:GT2 family glycosyltransferase